MSTEFFKAAAFALVTSASIAQADEDITYAMTTTQEASGFASATCSISCQQWTYRGLVPPPVLV